MLFCGKPHVVRNGTLLGKPFLFFASGDENVVLAQAFEEHRESTNGLAIYAVPEMPSGLPA